MSSTSLTTEAAQELAHREPATTDGARELARPGPATADGAQELARPGPGIAGGDAAAAPPSLWRRIRRDVLLLGLGNTGIIAAQLCFRGILVKTLVPAAYGRLSLILSIYNTIWILGASGLPNTVARYLSIHPPSHDAAIIRSALRAGLGTITVATAAIAVAAGVLLHSPLAGLCGAVGLTSLIYSLLTMGILRGRGQVAFSASIMPTAGIAALIPLVVLWRARVGMTPVSGFACFCAGNVAGLLLGLVLTRRTAPRGAALHSGAAAEDTDRVPGPRQLLRFSAWLAAATAGVAVLPLVIRSAAALESYTVVAVIDIAILLFSIPQRVGTVIVSAVVPHATRAVKGEGLDVNVSRRETLTIALPFALLAAVVAFTPAMRVLFDALGRPVYAQSSTYLALALLAAPARVLYGVVEGVLIAHGEGRFLAVAATSITIVATGVIFAVAALGHIVVAFAVFVSVYWATYLVGRARIGRLATGPAPAPAGGTG